MKTYQVGVILLCVLAGACKKDSKSGNNQEIQGKWELRREIGGVSGSLEYAPGTGIAFYFAGNGSFVQSTPSAQDRDREGTYLFNKVAGTANYALELNYTTFPNNILRDTIRFNGYDTLVFLPKQACCDFPASYYKRIAMPD